MLLINISLAESSKEAEISSIRILIKKFKEEITSKPSKV